MSRLYRVALAAIAHVSKLLVGFVLLKLIAHFLGAEGLGRLGHFMSLLTILSILAGGGVLNGVIKYVAEYRYRPKRLASFISSAAAYSLAFSIVLATLLLGLSKPIAELVFGDESYFFNIIVLGFAQVGFAYTNLVIGVSNGLGQTSTYARIQATGSLLAIPAAWLLMNLYGFNGAVWGLIGSLLLTVLPAASLSIKTRLTQLVIISSRKAEDYRRLFSFTLMLLASAVAFPLTEIVIRQHLIETAGYQEAGLWQAATRLSSAYTGVFSVVLAYWFMPTISAESSRAKIQENVYRLLSIMGPVFAIGACLFYLFRSFLIPVFLSSDFVALEKIINYQLIGDFFKICAYVIGFVGVAKAATGLYIGAEAFQSILFLVCSLIFTTSYPGAQGVMLGYALTYFLYFFACIVALRRYVSRDPIPPRGIPAPPPLCKP